MREGVRGRGRGTDSNAKNRRKRREDGPQQLAKSHVKKNSAKGTGSAEMSPAQTQTPAGLATTQVLFS